MGECTAVGLGPPHASLTKCSVCSVYLWKGVRATDEKRCRRLGGDRNGTRLTTTGDITRTTAWINETATKTREQGMPGGGEGTVFVGGAPEAQGMGREALKQNNSCRRFSIHSNKANKVRREQERQMKRSYQFFGPSATRDACYSSMYPTTQHTAPRILLSFPTRAVCDWRGLTTRGHLRGGTFLPGHRSIHADQSLRDDHPTDVSTRALETSTSSVASPRACRGCCSRGGRAGWW